jgi:lysophospholipase L1-like esterase
VRIVAAAAVVLGLATPATAQALTLTADRPDTGWIDLTVADAGDATGVAITEGGRRLADATPSGGTAVIRHAAIWRCTPRERKFTATASYPDGSTQTADAAITTPSCKTRLVLRARRAHGRITVRAADRWKVGGTSARSCVHPPARRLVCRSLSIPAGERTAARTYKARSAGLWRVALGTAYGQHVGDRFYVRPRGTLRLLATGDSMIQVVDTYLKERLGERRMRVRSDARISTGVSKPFLLNWPRHARKQARGIRPDVTVVFLGANDGFSFGGIDCCGDAWVSAYAKRVQAMMSAYLRGGRGLVYWLTLPAPRPAQWRPIYPAVNRAIKRAAATFDGAVRVLDIAKTFTPGYRFRQSMTWHGHRQSVRQPDGVHLSPSGASIAEMLIERALRKDGAM